MINDSRFYYGLGRESYEKSKYEEAIGFFIQSVKLREHFKTYELLYRCHHDLGNDTDARKYIKRAYSLNKKMTKWLLSMLTN